LKYTQKLDSVQGSIEKSEPSNREGISKADIPTSSFAFDRY